MNSSKVPGPIELSHLPPVSSNPTRADPDRAEPKSKFLPFENTNGKSKLQWRSLFAISKFKKILPKTYKQHTNNTQHICFYARSVTARTIGLTRPKKSTRPISRNEPWSCLLLGGGYCVIPQCSVTLWTHPEIIPLGQFFRRWIQSINQV